MDTDRQCRQKATWRRQAISGLLVHQTSQREGWGGVGDGEMAITARDSTEFEAFYYRDKPRQGGRRQEQYKE